MAETELSELSRARRPESQLQLKERQQGHQRKGVSEKGED